MQVQKSYKEQSELGSLYLVPTPIGNLEDMSYRAIKTLKAVTVIASEDTRNTQKLLNHFEIDTKQISFHTHNTQQRLPELLNLLLSGQDIAQVSDAGMPSISDPGSELVAACIEHGIKVISLPGATAGVTALIASGLSPDRFTFHGFPPRKKNEQLLFFEELKTQTTTHILYESPYRLKKTLNVMKNVFSDNHRIVICRELTKIHEEYLRGTLSEIHAYIEEHEIKGECCLLIEGGEIDTGTSPTLNSESLTVEEHVQLLMTEEQLSSKEAIKKVAKERQLRKQDVYRMVHQRD